MTKDRPKTTPRRSYFGSFFASFFASIFCRFGVPFWCHLGGFWDPKSVIFGIDFSMIFACRSKIAPRAAKSGPRAAQERPKSGQESPKSGQKWSQSSREPPRVTKFTDFSFGVSGTPTDSQEYRKGSQEHPKKHARAPKRQEML